MISSREGEYMRVTSWRGGTLGIRVGKANANKFFDRRRPMAEVEMDGKWVRFSLSETFWTTCPEIRGASICQWLRARALDTWMHGHPPEVELRPLGENCFRLSELALQPSKNNNEDG